MSQTLLPADLCVEALVIAGGNTHLAAERLFGSTPDAVANLLASIAQDPMAQNSLNTQLRTLTTLRAFDALTQAQNLLPTFMADMEAADFAKFYTSLIKNVTDLATSAPVTDPSDMMQRLVQALPPDARRAFLTLVSPQPSLSETTITIEHDAAGDDAIESKGSAAFPDAIDVEPLHQQSEGEAA